LPKEPAVPRGRKPLTKEALAVLHLITSTPGMTAREAARRCNVSRSSVERWCKEAGISLIENKHVQVCRILQLKQQKQKRLIRELADLEQDIQALERLDPTAPYIKKKAGK
jgi:transposase